MEDEEEKRLKETRLQPQQSMKKKDERNKYTNGSFIYVWVVSCIQRAQFDADPFDYVQLKPSFVIFSEW